MRTVIVMPVFEDWDAALELCRLIDGEFRDDSLFNLTVLLVDDGSTTSVPPTTLESKFQSIERIALLTIRRNLGHQRAIAVALAYLYEQWKGDAVVVMDADGEDRAQDIRVLLATMRQFAKPTAVFAERSKRLENHIFIIFYFFYRILHGFLAGRDIRFGNFSALPWSHLNVLVAYPELWNHYAATVLKSALPYVRVPCSRGVRLRGKSRMDFVSLLVHGLSALFANQEVVGSRLLVLNIIGTTILFVGIAAVIGVKFLTRLAIPGWATIALGLLLVLVSQSLIASFVLVFSIMMNRSQLGFLPVRDYAYFIASEKTLYQK
jgi:polyisoprenyl-phosphate glycosyltransferase